MSISVTEELVVNGFYEGRGFTRMAVFSSDLENKFELALAGNDIVYEIDWSDRQNPYLLTKYSLMPSSRVSQIFLNDRFLFVQSSTPTNQTIYNYTWTFNRGDRIYNRAFQVIKHTTAETMIDLNEQMSYLLVLDG